MRVYLQRNHQYMTRWGVFSNLLHRADRRACGGWYFHVHAGPFRLEVYGRV